jgi:hypothetical protein
VDQRHAVPGLGVSKPQPVCLDGALAEAAH